MTTRSDTIFTVPAGEPFLDSLARAILAGDLPRRGGPKPEPLDLPDYTLILPTSRATRAVEEAFLRVSGGRAMLLPKIVPISEGDEDASLFAAASQSLAHTPSLASIAPAMSEIERRLTLTSLVLRWSDALRRSEGADGDKAPFVAAGSSTPAQASALAAELAALMDMIETEDKTLEGLAALVPDAFSEHWKQTLAFLEIVTVYWPAVLAEKKLLSKAGRRNAVIRAEAARFREMPPTGPVIVAGVTGSIPATVELMKAVTGLANGALVLPALDLDLDDESWGAITPMHPEHPQFGLKTLLDSLGLARSDVTPLASHDADASRTTETRRAFIAEAMRPASTTARWQSFAADCRAKGDQAAPTGISLVEAPTAQDEAEVVALILRDVASTPGKTAALVSPDRLLARRVAVRLEAWGIKVDDSAGRPFRKTPPGALLDLVVTAVAERFAPPEVMALLKHPLCRLGLDPFAVRRAGRALEIAAFRTPYLGDGLGGIEAALLKARVESGATRRHPALTRLFPEDWDGAHDLVTRLQAALAPLIMAYESGAPQNLRDLAHAHTASTEAIARTPEMKDGDASPLWATEAGDAGARFFASLLDDKLPDLLIPPQDYADLYRGLVASENVRPLGPVHPRLSIWGPFEARLQQPDVVILGSLNDGTWPQSAEPGAWLNRPMRQSLGLPSPEEKIGQAAHDFATLLAAPEVLLTRAEKMDGVPTVPSRWLLRIKALLDGMGHASVLEPSAPWIGWARHRDAERRAVRIKVPEPRPPLAARPRKLSVSRIETWLANPYAIFAKEILALEPLDPLGKDPGASLRGSIIHGALSRFATAHPSELPADILGELLTFSREALADYRAHTRIRAFWEPRFERFAKWFAETEPARRRGIDKVVTETSGELVIAAPGGPFRLTARADRIDIAEGTLIISDYKTGTLPSRERVLSFVAPQLPLEAAIAMDIHGGFANIPKRPVATLRYISATGGEPPGEERDIKVDDIVDLAARAVEGLSKHIAKFDDEATPYRPLRRSRFSYDYDDYAHLARVAEWSSGATTGEDT